MNQQKRIQTMPSFPVVLFVIFLILKLIHVINWSWWWVTAPLWISGALAALLMGTVAGGVAWWNKDTPK